jgi:membrane-associated phospholipid phosphatase
MHRRLHVLFLLLLLFSFRTTQAQDSSAAPAAVGFGAAHRFNLSSFIVPAVLITTGTYYTWHTGLIDRYAVRDWRNAHYSDFHTSADDYLQYAPAVAVYALDAFGVKGRNDVRTQTVRLVCTEVIMTAAVVITKNATGILRPDNSADNSFPSGHTAQAFAAATFLHKEFGKTSPWISIAGYLVAGTVGSLRILNNRHWVTDVIAGAGIGMASAEIAYLPLFPGKKRHRKIVN